MKPEKNIEDIVAQAVNGSKDALEELVRRIQEPVYALALRMLFNPEDARDAAQEILTAVITNLRGYRREGPFRAWVMRIAVNKIKAVRRSSAEKKMGSIEDLDGILDRYEANGWFSTCHDIPQAYLEAETRSVCIHAILLCLDRLHRLAFILGVVMEVTSQEGAAILDITPAAFRKRLSRARSRIKDFLARNCGLFDSANRCRCTSILPAYLKKGWIDPDKPIFIPKNAETQTSTTLGSYLKEMDELKKVAWIYNAIPPSDFDFVQTVKNMLREKHYRILSDPRPS